MSTTRRCRSCHAPLPPVTHAGHRPRKFCNEACKQRYYRQHKRAARLIDADMQPLFQASFGLLQQMLDAAVENLAKERARVDRLEELLDYYRKRDEEMCLDYHARLQGLGMSNEQITQFDEYWQDRKERNVE